MASGVGKWRSLEPDDLETWILVLFGLTDLQEHQRVLGCAAPQHGRGYGGEPSWSPALRCPVEGCKIMKHSKRSGVVSCSHRADAATSLLLRAWSGSKDVAMVDGFHELLPMLARPAQLAVKQPVKFLCRMRL